ncbi:MAG TPA: signal recognition particle-docking protein FtsY [Chitinophagales bacterium]|nr:signal recognition particle-docking protein FtsY [Chitinophagales bacterium]
MSIFNFLSKEKKEQLDHGLEKTKQGFFSRIAKAVAGKSTIDAESLDEIEDALIASDVGVETTIKIIAALEHRVARDKYLNASELNAILKDEIVKLLSAPSTGNRPDIPSSPEKEAGSEAASFTDILTAKPYVIMVVGVNGVGKTTTIGKLAWQFKNAGKSVILGAADTFRAAAVDQLTIWSERVGVPLVKKQQGADPASVAYDTLESGIAKGMDVVIIDTAGRLHNKKHLMDELSKVRRVMQKLIPEAPHEVLLILDASTGQNAIEQARQFTSATDVNALCITKLDGTAKGGVVLGIVDQFKIPVKYIGVGEKKEDLQLFNKMEFVEALFNA